MLCAPLILPQNALQHGQLEDHVVSKADLLGFVTLQHVISVNGIHHFKLKSEQSNLNWHWTHQFSSRRPAKILAWVNDEGENWLSTTPSTFKPLNYIACHKTNRIKLKLTTYKYTKFSWWNLFNFCSVLTASVHVKRPI